MNYTKLKPDALLSENKRKATLNLMWLFFLVIKGPYWALFLYKKINNER